MITFMAFHPQRCLDPVSHVPLSRVTGRSAVSGDVKERIDASPFEAVQGDDLRARAVLPTVDPTPNGCPGEQLGRGRIFGHTIDPSAALVPQPWVMAAVLPGNGTASADFAHWSVDEDDGVVPVNAGTTGEDR